MKKIMLLLIGLLSMSYGISFGYVQSEQYNSKNTCENAIEKNNKLYPSYVRSNCYSKDSEYYYNICYKGEDCANANGNANANIDTENLLSEGTINGKPYYIRDKKVLYKDKLDIFLGKLVSLKDTKYNGKLNEYIDLLSNIIRKLNKLELKYNGNSKVEDIILYLKNGITLIEEHVKKKQEEKIKKSQINGFFCDLQGGCKNNEKSEAKKSEAKKSEAKKEEDNYINKLSLRKSNENNKEYMNRLDDKIKELNKLKMKYNGNSKITASIENIEKGINDKIEEVKKIEEEKANKEQKNSFLCDLQGGCNTNEKPERLSNSINKLSLRKSNENNKEYINRLEGKIKELNKLKMKYNGNSKITALIEYIEKGINNKIEEVKKVEEEKTNKEQENSFLNDLNN